MRRRSRRRTQEIDLNSLADIVTCSVGIVVLMMLQGVLVTGDIVAERRLPMLQDTEKQRVYTVCEANTIRPFDIESLMERFIDDMPPAPTSFDTAASFIESWDGKRVSSEHVSIEGFAGYHDESLFMATERRLDVGIYIRPVPGGAVDLPERVGAPSSQLNQMLDDLDPDQHYVSFLVEPGSIQAFLAAADVLERRGFQLGWQPFVGAWPLAHRLGGGDGFDPGRIQ